MIDLGWVIPYTGISVLQVLTAIIAIVIGFVAVKLAVSAFKKGLKKTKLPELVVDFLGRFMSILFYVVVILFAASALGIDTSSVTIGLSAIIGLILAFGLQETFKNLFAGIWLAALRPIDKGEVITTNGMTGKVDGIGIMATEMIAYDNKLITIPNSLVWGNITVNYSRIPTRRVDVDVGISYDDKPDKAIQVAMDLMNNHQLVLKDPAPAVVVTELADSSVNLQLRAWTNNADYWTVKFDLTKDVLETFKKEGIVIPYPQMDVHLEQK